MDGLQAPLRKQRVRLRGVLRRARRLLCEKETRHQHESYQRCANGVSNHLCQNFPEGLLLP